MKATLLVGVSVVALGFLGVSDASANPKNKFSDGSNATVTVDVSYNDYVGKVKVENDNTETEVLATNVLTAEFYNGEINMGSADANADADASAASSAAATADSTSASTAAASAASSANATAAASAAASASTNTEAGPGDQDINLGANEASADASAAADASGAAATAAADAAASADASADATAFADASADASADAARGGDLRNAAIVLNGNAMQRAAGAFAMNMGTAQFNNLNSGNAIAANVPNITIGSN